MTTTLRRPFSFRLNRRSRQCALTWEFCDNADKTRLRGSLRPRIDLVSVLGVVTIVVAPVVVIVGKENPREPCPREQIAIGGESDQPPTSEEMTSPNRSQLSPLKRISCNCESGAKSVGEVLTLTPGKRPKGSKSLMLAACFIMFSRVRLLPQFLSTCTRPCETM